MVSARPVGPRPPPSPPVAWRRPCRERRSHRRCVLIATERRGAGRPPRAAHVDDAADLRRCPRRCRRHQVRPSPTNMPAEAARPRRPRPAALGWSDEPSHRAPSMGAQHGWGVSRPSPDHDQSPLGTYRPERLAAVPRSCFHVVLASRRPGSTAPRQSMVGGDGSFAGAESGGSRCSWYPG